MVGATSSKLLDPFQSFKTVIASFSDLESVFKSTAWIRFFTTDGATEDVLSKIILLADSLSQLDFESNKCTIRLARSSGK